MPATGDQLAVGAYLTDGKRLWCVVDSHAGSVALENCMAPDENPCWLPVKAVLDGSFKLVRRG